MLLAGHALSPHFCLLRKRMADKLCGILTTCVRHIARSLGPGHSECIYQKALSLLLQKHDVQHVCEFTVPIMMQSEEPSSARNRARLFNLGGERIDVMMYDDDGNAHIVELKAIAASVALKRDYHHTAIPTPHMQVMKYINMRPVKDIVRGYVINFRQAATFAEPCCMPVEFVSYDTETKAWLNIDIEER